jgi:diaminopimelate decarboxylase
MNAPPDFPDADRLRRLARRFGTPLYAYDFDRLEQRARELRRRLPERIEILYAVKANPSKAVLALFASLGLGADVASASELAAALEAGVPAERILMSGPAKSDADLGVAVAAGIGGVNVEGFHELDRLEALAARRGRRVPVQLRLDPDPGVVDERRRILGGGGSKFGFALGAARRALSVRRRWPHLEMRGIQLFAASNVLDAGELLASAALAVELAAELLATRAAPARFALLDFGGGLGVPYGPADPELDVAALGAGFAELARRVDAEPRLAGARLLVEPGRWLTAPAGVYLTRVVEVKRRGRKRVVLVDGGIHQLLRPALVGQAHPVALIPATPRASGGRRSLATLAGPLCTSLDVLADDVRLAAARPGDLVVFAQAGAYGFTESMPLFLSRGSPAEVGLRGDRAALLRESPSPTEIRARERVPRGLVATPAPAPRSAVRRRAGRTHVS